MEVPHSTTVKEKLGKEAIAALEALFEAAKGTPPAVPIARFRADHPQWLDVLDSLQSPHHLIERSQDGKSYLLRSYALPLIEQADTLLDAIQAIYNRFRKLYPEILDETVRAEELLVEIDGDKDELMLALYYLAEIHDVRTTISHDFPYGKENYLCINERVLRTDSIASILSQYFEWHYINPKKQTPAWSPSDLVNSGETNFFALDPEHNFPAWYHKLDTSMREVIAEINIALNNNLRTLPAVGIRTLLDMVIVEKISDIGTFGEKLKALQREGFATPKQIQLLSRVLELGNAAAHRGHRPDHDDIMVCLDFVNNLMHNLYILHPNIERLHQKTPSRGSKDK